jgi:hypothetical protein
MMWVSSTGGWTARRAGGASRSRATAGAGAGRGRSVREISTVNICVGFGNLLLLRNIVVILGWGYAVSGTAGVSSFARF